MRDHSQGHGQRLHPLDEAGQRRRTLAFWLAASAVGLLLRLALLPLGPAYGYMADHDDFVRWGIQASDQGILTLYDHPPPRWNVQVLADGKWVTTQRQLDRLCNYPPLSTYLLWGSGLVFKELGGERLINTTTSRAIFASWSILGDFLLAAGCAALVRHFRGGPASRWAYLVALLAPPFWWDSVIWGQMDTVVLAPLVWMIWAMVRQRWILAGALYGIAAMLKPQAITLVPLWGYAIVFMRPAWKPLVGLAVAGMAGLVISLPYTLHSGSAWLQATYVDNLLRGYPATTLKAFNIWYADLLACDSDDVTRTLLGVTKDSWGKVLMLAALAGGLVQVVRHWGRDPRGLILWAEWTLLACVMLPTRVHERYLLLALPLLVAGAMLWRRLWPGLVVLLVVAMGQVTWPLWMATSAGSWERLERQAAGSYAAWRAALPPEAQSRVPSLAESLAPIRQEYLSRRAETAPWEWGLTGLALAGTVYTGMVMLRLRPSAEKGPQRQGG